MLSYNCNSTKLPSLFRYYQAGGPEGESIFEIPVIFEHTGPLEVKY